MIRVVDLKKVDPDIRITADEQSLHTPIAEPAGICQGQLKQFRGLGYADFVLGDRTRNELLQEMRLFWNDIGMFICTKTVHLYLQVVIRVEAQMIIEAVLVVTVAAFHLSVVPGSSGPDQLVLDLKASAFDIHRMHSIRFLKVCELCAVVRLYDVREVFEIGDRSVDEVHG